MRTTAAGPGDVWLSPARDMAIKPGCGKWSDLPGLLLEVQEDMAVSNKSPQIGGGDSDSR